MENKFFFEACELVNSGLKDKPVVRAFNSIGSNIFFGFGKSKKIILKNGRKSIQDEWLIWISDSSWRVAKKGKYIVGSGDSPEAIQTNIQKLLDKRFQSFQFLSQFLDVEFNFDEDYQLTTFFNWAEEDQWTLFLPDRTNIGVDCSSPEAIKNVQAIAEHLPINENYKKLELPLQDVLLSGITYDKNGAPSFHFENETSIILENCTWRIQKDGDYLIGYLDDDQIKVNDIMSELIGKKLIQIDVTPMMDARFHFENLSILETFSCCRAVSQWKIHSNNATIFAAEIQLNYP